MKSEFKPDYTQVRKFIKKLTGDPESSVTIQTLDDNQKEGVAKDSSLIRTFHGPLSKFQNILGDMNRRGAGVFLTINETDLKGRSATNILKIRACFVDDDKAQSIVYAIQPSIVLASKAGNHAYWTIEDCSLELFTPIQKALASFYNTDPSVSDLPRLMRMPGFCNMKDRDNPTFVCIREISDNHYTTKQIVDAHKINLEKPTEKKANVGSSSKLNTIYRTEIASFDLECFLIETQTPFKKVGDLYYVICPNCGQHSSNTDLTSTTVIFYEPGKRLSLDCKHAHCTKITIANFLMQYPKELVESYCSEIRRPENFKIAGNYLKELVPGQEKPQLYVAYFRGMFYRWKNNHFEQIDRDYLKADIIRFIHENAIPRATRIGRIADDVLEHLMGITRIPFENPPFFISDLTRKEELIALKSSLLRLAAFKEAANDDSRILALTPDYFNHAALPFDYDPIAQCPRWLQVLEEILPDQECRSFLQEFAGCLLTSDCSKAKILFLLGSGANGKGVVLTVLKALLGDSNWSALPIEAFDAKRTFGLASLNGKLANFCDEIGFATTESEGVLKNLSLGGEMSVERKNAHPFTMKNTAKFIFATNVIPRFKDRTDGIWRRIVILPFEVQFTDESKQDARLVDSRFWIESGEMPGVLNWALEGLLRFKARGSFQIPRKSAELNADYRSEFNPVARFLEDYFREDVDGGSEISQNVLYYAYLIWSKTEGQKAFAAPTFCQEIRRKFPRAKLTGGPQRPKPEHLFGQYPIKSRIWRGLKCQDDEALKSLLNSGPRSTDQDW